MTHKYLPYYNIYKQSFPDYPLSYEQFIEMSDIENCTLFEETENGVVSGYAVVKNNSIILLAVDEKFRNIGEGGRLLAMCESYFSENGIKEIKLCEDGIFQGVPLENKGAREFFEKHGYNSDFVSVNMNLDTEKFDINSLDIPVPENVTYRYARESEHDKVIEAVKKVVPDWVQYYENTEDKILIALCDGEIAAFELINEYGGIFTKGNIKHGCIGCVGTVPQFRNRGIGLYMTAVGADLLKTEGCDSIQLLYVERVKWYGKIGFTVESKQWHGKKNSLI